jgi:phenylalanyl-tRNA synthetase beta chain
VKFSVNWLREFVDIDVGVEKLGELLTLSGMKLESLKRPGRDIDGVIVAEVVAIADHPNADKLILVDVQTEDGSTRRVVCGAHNFEVGDRVPLATVGARLPDLQVSERKIRGEASQGMLCSGFELGISKDHTGILVLPAEAPLGDGVTTVLGLDDSIVEVEVTPNRGDCMGLLGIAREVAALLGHELRWPDLSIPSSEIDSPVKVQVEATDGCTRFTARYIEGVSINPAPSWMQARLVALGVRPISNIVDITNYVMLEMGHPLHAYDAAKIAEHTIIVRNAKADEKVTTLDGVTRTMHPDDILIADPTRPLGIGGVMGGEDSEVSESTADVILECARFDPATTAFTTRRHLLRTEASLRFERYADPEMAPLASARAARLIAELAGGRVASRMVDDYAKPVERPMITWRPERTSLLLGYEVAADVQIKHLRSVELEVEPRSFDDGFDVTVPTFRAHDLTREVDLIEEVARLAGYDRIPNTLPAGVAGGLEQEQAAERRLRRVLSGLGLAEAWTNSFGSPRELDDLGLSPDHPARSMVVLENPTSDDEPTLRTTLVPSLLRAVARNHAQRVESIALYEIARVYEPTQDVLPHEALVLTAVMSGARHGSRWRSADARWGFLAAKGVLEAALAGMELPAAEFTPVSGPPFHPTRAASISVNGAAVGALGELHPDVCDRFDALEGTVMFELALAPLWAALPERVKVEPLARFPAIFFDIALIVDESIPAKLIADLIKNAGEPEVARVDLFDVYRGPQIPSGKKSLAYALELRSNERTLSDADATRVEERILSAVKERTGAELRR